jgi:hypothetical protein
MWGTASDTATPLAREAHGENSGDVPRSCHEMDAGRCCRGDGGAPSADPISATTQRATTASIHVHSEHNSSQPSTLHREEDLGTTRNYRHEKQKRLRSLTFLGLDRPFLYPVGVLSTWRCQLLWRRDEALINRQQAHARYVGQASGPMDGAGHLGFQRPIASLGSRDQRARVQFVH